MKHWKPLAGIAVALAIVAYFLFGQPSAEAQIRAQLDALASTMHVEGTGNSSGAQYVAFHKTFERVFAENVAVQVPELGDIHPNRQEIVDHALQIRSSSRTLSLVFKNLKIVIDATKRSGSATADVVLTTTNLSGEERNQQRGVKLRFEEASGDWRITEVHASPLPED